MSDDRSRPLPSSRLGRLARMASLGARTGAGLLVSRDPDAIAAHAAEVLGSMRGIAAKVGQMASYVDGFVPEAQRASFEKALGTLRSAAPTSDPAAVRAVIEEELGPIESRFARFEEKPFASASIGQVHRAELKDGRQVAVKVQHPGVDRAIAADLENASTVEPLIRAAGGHKLDSARVFREIRERFEEELDYRREAENQRSFRRMLAHRPELFVPAIIDECSSRRVMTSELATGVDIDAAMQASESERHAWASALWAGTFLPLLVHGRFNADPHPGNFLFAPEGKVVLLDFGCVQPFDERGRPFAVGMHRGAVAQDEAAFATASRGMLQSRGGTYERVALAHLREAFEPIFRQPFHITRAYVRAMVEGMRKMKNEVLFARDGSVVPMPPGTVFVNRLQFGFYSVLARLDVEVDYAAIEREFLG